MNDGMKTVVIAVSAVLVGALVIASGWTGASGKDVAAVRIGLPIGILVAVAMVGCMTGFWRNFWRKCAHQFGRQAPVWHHLFIGIVLLSVAGLLTGPMNELPTFMAIGSMVVAVTCGILGVIYLTSVAGWVMRRTAQ